MDRHLRVILVGPKHSGKSTIARALARALQTEPLDTDDLIRDLSGKTPRELYDEGGAALMAEWETKASQRAAETVGTLVLATGGGLADNPEAFAVLKRAGSVVHLAVPFETAYERVLESAKRDGRMPAYLTSDDPREEFRKVFARRGETYATLSDVSVTTEGLGPMDISRLILDRLAP